MQSANEQKPLTEPEDEKKYMGVTATSVLKPPGAITPKDTRLSGDAQYISEPGTDTGPKHKWRCSWLLTS